MLPFVGPDTFFRAPYRSLHEEWEADVGFLGVPWDITVGYRPGARFAPQAVRQASLRYALPSEGYYHPHYGYRLAGLRMVDAGDVDIPTLEYTLAHERITESARALRARVRLPVFIGGDHSISYPLLCAYADVPDLHGVQIDAHLDFSDERSGTRYSNSSPFRRAVEALPNLVHITTIGLRGVRFDPEAVAHAQARRHTLVFREEANSAPLPQGKPVYLSIDVDAFDPALMPATSSPEPEGLTYAEVVQIIERVARQNTIVGIDLVEMVPSLDPTGNSALIVARLLVDCLLACFSSPASPDGR